MITLLDDAPLIQYVDRIGLLDGTDPMRDQDGGAFAGDVAQFTENSLLGVRFY